jgi:nucleotide-binding universal stress UspA family protein
MARSLVVGFDGSACASAALDEAIALASATGDRIVIGFGYDPGGPGEEYRATRDQVRELGERVARPALERALEAGVDAQLELVEERPVEALLELAQAHDARAIVVGTYGEGPIRGAILGSTPHKLLPVADRPVLVVPVRGGAGEPQ